jgi:hypothetical protein
VDAVERAVRELLTDPGRRSAYAERGRRRAAAWPTEEQTVAAVRAVYAELTSRSGPS